MRVALPLGRPVLEMVDVSVEALPGEVGKFHRIATLAAVEGDLEEVHEAAKQHVDKFLISLGGEHSITPALIAPYLEKYPKLSVLQIDAHTDRRDEFEGTKYSHACAMRRVAEQGIGTIVSVGIRNSAKEEQPFLNQQNVNLLLAHPKYKPFYLSAFWTVQELI